VGVEYAKRIVLVGPDCSGKSTLAKNLSSYYGIPVKANRRIPDDLEAVASVIDMVRHLRDNPDAELILDQWQYPVDIVYNRHLRNTTSPMEHIEPVIVPYLNEAGVLFLHVDARSEVLRERYKVRGDELWNAEQIVHVASAYRTYFERPKVHYRRIDTSYGTPESVLKSAVVTIETFYRGLKNE
jgi:hypothetical protein